MSYDARYDESISDHVTNKNTGAYDSNIIIVRAVLSSLKLPREYFHMFQIFFNVSSHDLSYILVSL